MTAPPGTGESPDRQDAGGRRPSSEETGARSTSRRLAGLIVGGFAGMLVALASPAASVRASFDWLTWATEERGQTADAGVVVVALDRELLRAHGVPGEARLHRAALAQLVTRLAELKPRAIGLDVEFPRAREREGDAELARAIAAAGTVIVPEAVVTLPGDGTALTLREPISPIAAAARHVGFVTLRPDEDETVRRVGLVRSVNGTRRYHFALLAAARMLGAEGIQVLPDAVVLARRSPSPAHVVPVEVTLDQPASAWIRFTGDRPVPVIPGSELMRPGGADARWRALVADRFALVGGVEELFEDHHRVPAARVDAHRQRLPGVLVLGQIIADVLDGRCLIRVPAWLASVLFAALSMLAGWLAGTRRLWIALLCLAGIAIGAVLLSIQLFLSGSLMDALGLALLPLLVFIAVRSWPGASRYPGR